MKTLIIISEMCTTKILNLNKTQAVCIKQLINFKNVDNSNVI